MISLDSFFEQSTNDIAQEAYCRRLKENIFLAIELSGMSYVDILKMPVQRLEDYLTWKIKFDQDREKIKSDAQSKIKF